MTTPNPAAGRRRRVTSSGVRWPACARCAGSSAAPVQSRPRSIAALTRAGSRRDLLHESHATAAAPAVLSADDELTFSRTYVRAAVMRKLKRGRIAVEAEIDLHGLRQHAAQVALQQFLNECVRRGLRCVRVIHGKGLRSGPGGPVLKLVVHHWLRKVRERSRGVRSRATRRRRLRRGLRPAGGPQVKARLTPPRLRPHPGSIASTSCSTAVANCPAAARTAGPAYRRRRRSSELTHRQPQAAPLVLDALRCEQRASAGVRRDHDRPRSRVLARSRRLAATRKGPLGCTSIATRRASSATSAVSAMKKLRRPSSMTASPGKQPVPVAARRPAPRAPS